MISPGCVKSGDWLVHIPSGVKVKLINADGAIATVRLPDGSWAQYANHDLGYSTATVNDSKGPALDPRGGSNVGTGPVSEKVSGAGRVMLESHRRDHPTTVGDIVDNYGTVVNRGPLAPGSQLIEKATGRGVTLFAGSEQRGLWVCKLSNGAFEIFRTDELLTGDRQPLAKAAVTLQKLAKASGSFNRGDRVRLRVATHPWPAGKEGVLKLCGRTGWVEFPNGSGGAFDYEDLEAI